MSRSSSVNGSAAWRVSGHSCLFRAENAGSDQRTAAEAFVAPETRDETNPARARRRERGRSGHDPNIWSKWARWRRNRMDNLRFDGRVAIVTGAAAGNRL